MKPQLEIDRPRPADENRGVVLDYSVDRGRFPRQLWRWRDAAHHMAPVRPTIGRLQRNLEVMLLAVRQASQWQLARKWPKFQLYPMLPILIRRGTCKIWFAILVLAVSKPPSQDLVLLGPAWQHLDSAGRNWHQ
eukprot:CAMPEP_0117616816 /NCGR_PEP_ID=MMETSP0784-20121206/85257_1 /TAXON_ID=39447 /ORGANISM="" /LENGTH=133 /DNA_ID=CAMNT_0005420609 /DNA_START=816 /DNA_END=1215 /DNA_ORIENTATION=-